MAALLKKRALAEYSLSQSQTVAVGRPPTPKRLRLIKKPALEEQGRGEYSVILENEINALDSGRPAAENFRALSKIASGLPSTVIYTIQFSVLTYDLCLVLFLLSVLLLFQLINSSVELYQRGPNVKPNQTR